MAQERLQKYLSECSVASRRKSEELIKAGKVKVNGRVAQIGDKIDTKKDTVTVNGKKVVAVKQKYYIMLNKPRGYVTTMSDELGRKCVAELVQDVGAVVYPVGRLDRDSEGLLLLTNDGEFANAVMHPRKHVPKTYRVTVRSNINDAQIEKLENGIDIDGDGRETLPASVRVIEKSAARSVLEITIFEGRNRQIRKMCESVSLEVIRLKRNAVGSIKLGMLQPGKWRELTDDEVHKLQSQ
ncbi:MAG: rRNA pseudouridine synthase [Ruminococcaceae bacterium]|nr:rRNA pseudouridine synthase [Oscillospiraceae bacterium]